MVFPFLTVDNKFVLPSLKEELKIDTHISIFGTGRSELSMILQQLLLNKGAGVLTYNFDGSAKRGMRTLDLNDDIASFNLFQSIISNDAFQYEIEINYSINKTLSELIEYSKSNQINKPIFLIINEYQMFDLIVCEMIGMCKNTNIYLIMSGSFIGGMEELFSTQIYLSGRINSDHLRHNPYNLLGNQAVLVQNKQEKITNWG